MRSLLARHRTISGAATLLSAVLLLLAGWAPARAQYNGPPTSTDRSAVTTVTNDQTTLFPSTPETVLASGDQIGIRLFSDPDYNVSIRIAVDGTVVLPLIGSVQLNGLTIRAAEQLIAQRLESAGMYRNPQVIVSLAEGPSAVVTLAGEMHAVIPVVGSRNLYAILAAGGGLPPGASRTVVILRAGQKQPLSVDVGNDPLHSAATNVPVFPGDTIVVSRIGVVYLMGEFRNPGIVALNNYGPMTLSQVAALVGGPVFDAKYSELHIIRTVGDHRTVSTVNIKNILYGRAPDPIMEPNDIVFLPPSAWKASTTNGSLGSVLGIVSFAIAAVATFR